MAAVTAARATATPATAVAAVTAATASNRTSSATKEPRERGALRFAAGKLLLTAVVAATLVSAVPAFGAAVATPTLGRIWAPNQSGYGEIKPSRIFNGGDPTGLIRHVRWTRWGQKRAVGSGIAYWVWPGLGVADGTIASRAVVVAYDLGRCHGKPAYLRIAWFFPKYGESFDPRDSMNICTGQDSSSQRHYDTCGAVALRSPPGHASHIDAAGVTCAKARKLIAGSASARYLHRGGRFRVDGLYCGSEGDRAVGPPALFECARGRVDIVYHVTA